MMSERIFRARGVLPLIMFACALMYGCSGDEPVASDITGPSVIPLITSIEPSEAAPGDRIKIRGSNFGADAGAVAVTVNGVVAEIVSLASTEIVAIVPEASAGTGSVVVSVRGRPSGAFTIRLVAGAPPAVTAVEPIRAHPGERITITGSNFGSRLSDLSVIIGGRQATVSSASGTAIVAAVPGLPPGTATLVVSVRGLRSNGFAYEILRPLPFISLVQPASTRAGLVIRIVGQNFGEISQVLFDETALPPQSATPPQILARVPAGVAVGTHSLRVRVGEDTSAPRPVEVDDFDTTGTYVVEATTVSNRCSPVFGPSVGTRRKLSISLTDHRPDLVATADSVTMPGTVSSTGQFSARAPSALIRWTVAVSGRVTRRVLPGSGVVHEIDLTIVRRRGFIFPGSFCHWREHAIGTRR